MKKLAALPWLSLAFVVGVLWWLSKQGQAHEGTIVATVTIEPTENTGGATGNW